MVEIKKINTFTGHQGAVYTLEKGPTPNLFYSSGADGQIIEWDIDNPDKGRLIAKVTASVYALKFIPVLNTLIVGQNFEGIHLIDVNKREELGSLKMTDSQIFDIQLLGDRVLIGTGDGKLHDVGLNDLQVRRSAKLSESSLRTLSVAPNGSSIIAGFSDNAFRVIDSHDFTPNQTVQAHDNSIFSTQFSPDTKTLITGSRDAHLKFWNVEKSYMVDQEIVAHMYAINHIVFHPDGHLFATASMDKTIKIWDYEKRKLIKVIDKARHGGHLTSVNKLYWSEHDNYLISGSDDRSVSVWEIVLKNV